MYEHLPARPGSNTESFLQHVATAGCRSTVGVSARELCTNGTIGQFDVYLSTYGFAFGLGYVLIAAPFGVALGLMSWANKVSHVTLLDEFGSEEALEQERHLRPD